MTEPSEQFVLWQARDGRPATGEVIGVLFGCLCAGVLLVLVLRRIGFDYSAIAPASVFAVVLASRLVASIRGRVRLSADGIEVRRLFTRTYRWASLRAVRIDDGQIEITPNGWVRRLPIPKAEAEVAHQTILDWRERFTR